MAERCNAWRGFEGGTWEKEVNVRSFIKHNYTPYDGDEKFLEPPTEATVSLWNTVLELFKKEIIRLVSEKNRHEAAALLEENGVDATLSANLLSFIDLYGKPDEVISKLDEICTDDEALICETIIRNKFTEYISVLNCIFFLKCNC